MVGSVSGAANVSVTVQDVVLQWAGAGNPLNLAETISGATPAIVILSPRPAVSLLKIDLAPAIPFAAASTALGDWPDLLECRLAHRRPSTPRSTSA